MGTEAVWIPLVMSAVATGATMYNTQQTAKRQDNALADQIRASTAKQRQADDKTKALIDATRNSTDADEKAGSLAKFTEQLQASRGNALRPLNQPGAVSAEYKKAGSDAALGMGKYANNIADLVSSIDAPGQQRQNDRVLTDDYQIALNQLRRESAGDNFLAQMRLHGIKRNPWIDAGSSALKGYAGAMGGGVDGDANSGWNFYGGAGENGMGTQVGADSYNGFGAFPGYSKPRTWQHG